MKPPPPAPAASQDPLLWQGLIVAVYAVLVFRGLAIPSKPYFDEIHYVPAARALLAGLPANPEHPLVAKEAIALAIRLLGDTPLAWRLPGALMSCAGLLAFGRALWWASGRAVAAVAGMLLLASDFLWFVQSRIAMLDMVMAGFAMLALWLAASALGERGAVLRRLRLAGCGACLGLAMGAKWSVLPLAAVVVGGLLLAKHRRGQAVLPGVSPAEMLAWLASFPLLVYWLTFWPAFFYRHDAISPTALVGWHHYMLSLQTSVIKHHPYQSVWWQWVIDARSIWYLYEVTDGAQRGVMLIGNPFSMLAGLAALVWAAWRRGWLGAALGALYAGSLLLWIVGHKPVQFYYHYLLPSTFLMAALALAVDALWQAGGHWRREALGVLVLALAVFAWFWPILSGAPLHKGSASFEDWMWLESWR